MNSERRLTVRELGARFIHESRLANLVLPLLASGQQDSIALDFAYEFADAFNVAILQEGKPAFDFFNGLKQQEKDKIISILSQGGMAGSVYISGDDIFSI